MKTVTDTRHAVTNVEDSKAFTIQATGKAFRTLIDGIYSNKILAPVRELLTNAYDGHLAAETPDRPFDVHVPCHQEPFFAVRDYGVGMDHETVMGLYTTLFESSKDQTNDQVGKFGLGSKSPFAYADSFTVTCYDGSEKRAYLAHMDQGIPQLGLLYREPSTEERGVEVQFPVDEPRDFKSFANSIQRVLLGFDVAPTLIGEGADLVEQRQVMDQGEGYKVFRKIWGYDEYLSPVNVRQGCVVYPVSDVSGSEFAGIDLPDNVRFIIDIPIGTSEITTDRERLAADETSVANIRPYLDNAFLAHKDRTVARYEAATTRLEKMTVLSEIDYEWRRAFKLPLNLTVKLADESWDTTKQNDMAKAPGYHVKDARKVKETRTEFSFLNRDDYTFILDQEGVVRRRGRTTAALKDGGVHLDTGEVREDGTPKTKWHYFHDGRVFVVPVEKQATTVQRLKTLCGFTDEQFISVADLSDPGSPTKGGKGGTSSQTSKKYLQSLLDSGMPWVNRMRGKVSTSCYRYDSENWDNPWVRQALGVDEDLYEEVKADYARRQEVWDSEVVVPLSNAQIEALKPDPEMEVGKVLERAFAASGIEDKVREQVFNAQLRHDLIDHLIDSSSDLARLMLEAEGVNLSVEWDAVTKKAMYMNYGVSQVRDITIGRGYYRNHLTSAQKAFQADEDLISQAIEALRRKYPALFSMDEESMIKYIKEVNAS